MEVRPRNTDLSVLNPRNPESRIVFAISLPWYLLNIVLFVCLYNQLGLFLQPEFNNTEV